MKTWITKSGYRITRLLARRSSVFLVAADGLHILVDTCTKGNGRMLEKRLQSLGIGKIDYLVITHTHFDHAGNAGVIREKYNAKVIVHRSEAAVLSGAPGIVPTGTNPFTRLLTGTFGNWFISLWPVTCQADILVDSIHSFFNEGINAYIIHTPGHSPGSMSLIVDDEIAITGDAMFGVFHGSIFPPFALDIKEMVKSWGLLLNTGCHTFLPAHGGARSRRLVDREFRRRQHPASCIKLPEN